MNRLSLVFLVCASAVFLSSLGDCALCGKRLRWSGMGGIGKPIKYVKVGPAGLFVLAEDKTLQYRNGTRRKLGERFSKGNTFTSIAGLYNSIDVGTDTAYALNSVGKMMCRKGMTDTAPLGTKWKKAGPGRFLDVSHSPAGQLVAINARGKFTYRDGFNNKCTKRGEWITPSNDDLWLKKISVGKTGIWALDGDGMIWYRTGSANASADFGTGWEKAEGNPFSNPMVSISAGDGMVLANNDRGNTLFREGLATSPLGEKWAGVPGGLKDIDSSEDCWSFGMIGNGIWYTIFQ